MSEPRADDQGATTPADEQPPKKRKFKSEDEMNPGKNYRLQGGEARFEFDPANHQASEEGGEPQ